MRLHKLSLIALLVGVVLVATLYAQATHIQSSGTLPAACRVGDIYVKTGASAGLYACVTVDTWTGPYSTSGGSLTTPGTTTDEAIVRWNGTGGTAIQDSGITVSDGNVITFPDGVRQTFNPDGTNAGLNFGSQAGDPSSLNNGDCWYNSSANKFKCRENGATSDMIGGSGGNSTETTAIGSESLTTSGDINFYTNSVYVSRYNGSTWVPWGPIFPMNPPVSGDFSWINQGGASVDTTNGGVYLNGPAGSGVNWRLRVKSATAPFTVTAVFMASPILVDFHQFGLVFRESGTGEIHACSLQRNAAFSGDASLVLGSLKYTSATAFSAAYSQADAKQMQVVFLRIADDNSNRICSYSVDGQHWVAFHTIGRTDFLTADQVGFGVDVENTTHPLPILLLSWVQS